MNEDENKKEQTAEDEKIEGAGKAGTQASENKDEGNAEKKTYTQEEYNALDKKLREKYERKYEGVDLAKYKEWQESQKTAEQKQTEKEQEYQKTLSKNAELNMENKVFRAGVNPDDVDYVVFKVSKLEGDFEENLQSFLKENPKYLVSNTKKEEPGAEVNLGGAHNSQTTQITQEQFDRMGYQARLKLYEENKALYEKLAKKN